jgi:PhnB protein
MADVKAIPDGYPTVSPYLCVNGASDAIAFYTAVLGATERVRMPAPGGLVGHAELQIGDSVIMLSDEFPEMGNTSPTTVGGSPVTLSMYVDDVDGVFDRAIERGATAERPVEDQFYGDRTGLFVDPYGHRWSIATHVEDVSPEEMQQRAAEMMQAMGG